MLYKSLSVAITIVCPQRHTNWHNFLTEHPKSCIHNSMRFILHPWNPAQYSGFPETYASLASIGVWHIGGVKGLSPKSRSSSSLRLPPTAWASTVQQVLPRTFRLGTLLATLASYWSGMPSSAWTKRAASQSHRSCWMSARVQGCSSLWKLSEISKPVAPRCRKPKND